MESKLSKVLLVCLITFTVISPALMVYGTVWYWHVYLVKTHQLVDRDQFTLYLSMFNSLKQWSIAVFPSVNTSKFLGFAVFAPVGFCLGLLAGISTATPLAYRYRAAILEQQIAALERAWKQSIQH